MVKEQDIESLRHTQYSSDSVVMEMLDTIEKLWKIVRVAEKMINRPAPTYSHNSRKFALREALRTIE